MTSSFCWINLGKSKAISAGANPGYRGLRASWISFAASKANYEKVTGGKYVPDRAAEKMEKIVGLEASKEQHQMIAQASHWGLGIGGGSVYAVLRRLNKNVAAAHGLFFGVAFSAIIDEGLTPLLGLAEAPKNYPWQAHARGIAGHLVYGATAESALKCLNQAG